MVSIVLSVGEISGVKIIHLARRLLIKYAVTDLRPQVCQVCQICHVFQVCQICQVCQIYQICQVCQICHVCQVCQISHPASRDTRTDISGL